MIVILGAGLAGLSTAFHLEGLPWRIYEAEKEVGGLCRSIRKDDFTFDYTGHLFYLHHGPVKALIDKWMKRKLHTLRRSAWIFSSGTQIPFPFQVNTFGLPSEVRLECLLGFVESLAQSKAGPEPSTPKKRPGPLDFLELKLMGDPSDTDMETWVLNTFGPGFARHFFTPYNEKFWQRPLKELTAEWASWSVPVPDLEEVLRGAMGTEEKRFGYNTEFLYPKRGGIRVLPDSLAQAMGHGDRVHLGKEAVSIEAQGSRVRFRDGEEASFQWLVSSIPLNRLVSMIQDAPEEVQKAATSLKSLAVYGVNVGLEGDLGHDRHWTYFPERDYVFYRVGYISNYAPGMAPEGHCSLTAEVTRRPEEGKEPDLEDRVIQDLTRAGMIKGARQVELIHTMRLDPAYVVFDRERQAALPLLFDYLMKHRIMPVGRYGTWNYMGMEDSLLHGIQAASRIKAEGSAGG
jgi:protoporphyrinogen oxidase